MNDLEVRLERLRSPEIRDRIENGWNSVLFACGSVEQHGPHLPLFTDAEIGNHLALKVARRMGRVLVAPTIRIGISDHHMAFSGTISLRRETFEAIVTDYVTCLAHHGFKRIMILPSHGGNFAPLMEMEDRLRKAAGEAVVDCYTDLIELLGIMREESENELGFGDKIGGHADLGETSMMLSLHPELVRQDLAEIGFQAEMSDDVIARIIQEGFDSVSPNGIIGDARGATKDLGNSIIETLAIKVTDFFQSISSIKL